MTVEPWPRFRHKWVLLVGLFSGAALPRLLYLVVMRPPFEGYHWTIADDLLRRGVLGEYGVRTAYYEPLYPVFLSLLRLLPGDSLQIVQALQALVDSVGVVLLYLLLEAATGRRRVALCGAALYATYPLLIRHAVLMGEVSLLSVLLIAFAYTVMTATTLRRVAAAGMWLGLAILTRAMIAPVAALAMAVFLIHRRRAAAVVLAVTTATVISPLVVRNYVLNGALWPTRGGVNLFIANSTYAAALLPEYNHDLLLDYADSVVAREQPALFAAADERELDRFYTTLALKEMRARPLQTMRLMLRKVAYFFWPRLVPSRIMAPDRQILLGPDGQVRVENAPTRPARDDIAYTLSFCLVAAAALIGIWVRRFDMKRDAMLWCIVLTFVATYAVFIPATRYRAPMEFVLLFYAAVGCDVWIQAIAHRRVG